MKFLLVFSLSLLSLNGYSYVSECEQSTTLKCEVTYYAKDNDQNITTTKISTQAHYELVNWDEPSLAFCQAWVGFNKKGLYIEAHLTEESQSLSIRMMKSHNGEVSNDQASSEMKFLLGETYTSSLSLGNQTTEGVYASIIKCNVNK
ncbi:MAG: hypothetical protein K2P81_06240 [Bacteriovoracaceae bacterium]|nr:hypothetical protein [Bacteriovoracaceae bacterium]